MANRFPLIVDKDDQNKLKELPLGDNLDLAGSGVVNASSIQTSELIVGGIEYNPFSGSYDDLSNKPSIPTTTDNLTEGDNNKYASAANVYSLFLEGAGMDIALNAEDGTITFTSSGGSGGAVDLDDLLDVSIASPSQGEVVKFNTATQVFQNAVLDYDEIDNTPTLADVATSGSYTDLTNKPTLVVDLDDLADVDVSTNPPTSGQVLKYNGTAWVPALDIAEGGGGLDADTLDGQDGTYYLDWNNTTNKPTIFDGSFDSLTDVPTTISGYGIADGVSKVDPVTLEDTLTVEGNAFNLGANADLTIVTSEFETAITSTQTSKDLVIKVRDAVGLKEAISISTSSNHVGIFESNPQYALDVNGDFNADTLYGDGSNLTDITLDQVITGSPNTTQQINVGNINPSDDSTYDIGTDTLRFQNVYADTLHGDGSNITNLTFSYNDLSDKPTSFTGLTGLQMSAGTGINEFSTDGTLAGNSDNVLPTEAAVKTYVDTAISSFDSVGNFNLANSNIDTDDSSAITITPAVTMQSDLTVENDLVVNNDVTINGTLRIDTFQSTDTGTPTLASDSVIVLDAQDEVRTTAPFRLVNLTSTERDNLTPSNGHMIYNTTTNKVQAYANGAWVDLH